MMDRGVDIGQEDDRTVVQVSGEDPYPERGISDPPPATFVRPRSGSRTAADVRREGR